MNRQTIEYLAFLYLCSLTGYVVSECAKDERKTECSGDYICHGGNASEFTDKDMICMLKQSRCDKSYRDDTCGKCDQNPEQYTYGSRYKDCSGECFETVELASEKVVDNCGVCGGTDSTCSPKVSGVGEVLIPDTANMTFNITGMGLRTRNIQILLLSPVTDLAEKEVRQKRKAILNEMDIDMENKEEFSDTVGTKEMADTSMVSEFGHNRFKRAVKTIKKVLPVVKVYDETTLEIRAVNVPAGVYEVGARTGDDGQEYQGHTGPALTVYSESDYSVDSLAPTEQDLDGSETVTVTLQLSTTSKVLSIVKMFSISKPFKCFFSDNMEITLSSDATSSVDGDFTSSDTTLECRLEIPETSKETWVCASFNKRHLAGCQKITFFETAPIPVENVLTFKETGEGLYVTFDKPVYSEARPPCSLYFTDVDPLGKGSKCRFKEKEKYVQLSVRFGDEFTVRAGDILELKAGLVSREGSFKRQSQAVNLTLTLANLEESGTKRESIEIAPRSSWPTKLTAAIDSPIILEIQTLKLPGNIPPVSIIWTVNDNEQESASGNLEMVLDVSAAGRYDITVTATDFLGGESVIRHSLNKESITLPTVVFSPVDLKATSDGKFIIHPTTNFIINTKIFYKTTDGRGLDAYTFQWKRNGASVQGEYFYKAEASETTIDMCGQFVEYSMVTSTVEDTSNIAEYPITMLVECRDPIAHISGNGKVNIDRSHEDITIYGSISRDPDGGSLAYSWTCTTLGDTNCMDKVTSKRDNSTTSKLVTISPSRMIPGKKYAITLTVSVEKSGERYSETDKVIYAIQAGNKPVIRWVTIRTKFRQDVRIMIKAHVGTDVTVAWRFVPNLEIYDWIDAENKTTGKASRVTEGFAWYTIHAGVLKPGSQYKMELEVSKDGLVTTEEYDIYIYEILRGCTVEVRSMVELEESTISLRNCVQDPDVTRQTLTCTAGNRELHFSQGLSFIVPIFKRGTTSVIITCEIADNLNNRMVVTSGEIAVTQATGSQKADDTIARFKKTGDLLGALGVMAELADSEDEADKTVNDQAAGLINQIVSGDPNTDDIRRSLKGFKRLKIDKINIEQKETLADNLVRMLGKLCSTDPQDGSTVFNGAEIKDMIENSKRLMESKRKLGPLYRDVENKIACIKFKHMQNEEYESVEFEDGTKHYYLVNTLEDVDKFGLDIEFPEDLKRTYRDQRKSGESEVYHGVGIKLEEYVSSEPPDLLFGRTDQKCKRYVIVDLYNPLSGERISVKDLEGTVNFGLGDQCPRAKCWYYDEFLKRYSHDGVYTETRTDGSIRCQAKHMTAFTVRSEPELYKGRNLPYIIAVCVGVASLLLSAVILVKLLLFIKHQANAVTCNVDDEKQLNLNELNASVEELPMKKARMKKSSP